MTTTAEVAPDLFVEFRCTKCYQLRHEPAANMGTEVPCQFCGQEQMVPMVSDDQLIEADRVMDTMSQFNVQQGQFQDKPLTRDEVESVAKSRAEERNAEANEGRGSLLHADPSTRLFAAIIDYFIMFVVLFLSFGIGQLTEKLGPSPETLSDSEVLLYFVGFYLGLFVCYNLITWALIARTGQTPGKMILGIKIVNGFGDPPGFFAGVVVRCILAGIIFPIIPLGPLVNVLLVFHGTPPRCGHDYLAGTDVVHS